MATFSGPLKEGEIRQLIDDLEVGFPLGLLPRTWKEVVPLKRFLLRLDGWIDEVAHLLVREKDGSSEPVLCGNVGKQLRIACRGTLKRVGE